MLKLLHAYILTIVFCSVVIISGCVTQVPASEIAGLYQDDVTLTVRARENKDFTFTRADSLIHIQLTILSDGSVEGFVGQAQFKDATCTHNRGNFGRAINIKSDYIIRGSLTGKIFPNDPSPEKEISLPFNLESGRIHGTLFQLDSPGIYPMAGPGDNRAE